MDPGTADRSGVPPIGTGRLVFAAGSAILRVIRRRPSEGTSGDREVTGMRLVTGDATGTRGRLDRAAPDPGDPEPATTTRTSHRSDSRYWVPELGYRNYWQPAVESRRVGRKPVLVRIMGEELTVFRTPDGVKAIHDICPHRGARLHQGKVLFPGTVSCPYHGWTFDGAGRCVAALTDGPDSPIPRQARVASYPTAEALGMIWVYLGDKPAPDLLAGIPRTLAEATGDDYAVQLFRFRQDWATNWRITMDNAIDAAHAFYLHRPALWVLFDRVPAFVKVRMVPTSFEDPEQFVSYEVTAGEPAADYEGIGRWPRTQWWRRRTNRFSGHNAIGLPGVFILRGPRWTHVRWAVPIDRNTTRNYMWAIKRGGPLTRLLFTANFWVWLRWIFYYNFSAQDKRMTETIAYENLPTEKLAATDRTVQAWRRLAHVAR
jgi:phenylpropionate dioxygenase-like ring-hydroxylating dioxygenase large terminal subunit